MVNLCSLLLTCQAVCVPSKQLQPNFLGCVAVRCHIESWELVQSHNVCVCAWVWCGCRQTPHNLSRQVSKKRPTGLLALFPCLCRSTVHTQFSQVSLLLSPACLSIVSHTRTLTVHMSHTVVQAWVERPFFRVPCRHLIKGLFLHTVFRLGEWCL